MDIEQPISSSVTHTVIEQPEYVGGYHIFDGSLIMSMTRKPNLIQRFFSEFLLGWVWIDAK